MHSRLPLALLATAGILTGCAVGPNYERPELELPDAHRADTAEAPSSVPLPGWRDVFEDEILQRLIERGLDNNLDLAATRSRMRQAEAELSRARAPLYPTIDLKAGGKREDKSVLTGGDGLIEDTYTFLGLLSWELDIWGFNRRRAEAATADLESAEWRMYAQQVSLIGAISATYYNLIAVNQQLALTQSTITTREQTLRIQELRNESGVISGLEVAQAKVALAQAEQQLPRLKNNQLVFENQLRRLLGEAPDAVETTAQLQDMPLTEDLPAGLPSDLLERRPDVRVAELGLVAANAEVGVAKADLLPRISLTGGFGQESAELSDLLDSDGSRWIADLTVTQPVFNAGARRAAVSVAWERREQAELAYIDTVLRSLEDVSNSLSTFTRAGELAASTARLRDAAQEYLSLATKRYSNGVIGYIDVLVAQRQYFDAELALIDAVRDRHLTVALLYRSLGGGWEPEDDEG
ncbi:MAG: efflux transporter outer membrane subunit [Woeseiaceae bacterium]|jgi:NodT family efflux transporter outer membrane factor (OMF) lipoprotein